MFKRKRARNLAVLVAVFALTAGASLAQVQSAKASGFPYAESVYRQASLGKTWCITAVGSSPGSPVVLGKCAGAKTQLLLPIEDNPYYELKFESSGLCITYPNAQGHYDGVKAEQGKCVNDVSQLFAPEYDTVGDLAWFLGETTDNNGYNIAIDDAGGVLKVYNPIDSSYVTPEASGDDGQASEDFGGPDCIPDKTYGGTTNC